MPDTDRPADTDLERWQTWPEWLDFCEPDRIDSQVQTFLTDTIPDVPDGVWWDTPVLEHIETAVADLFPDVEALTAPGRAEIADQFVCFLGELFVHRAGGLWINVAGDGDPLYDLIGPSIAFEHTLAIENVVDLALSAVEDGFSVVTMVLGDYAREYAATT